MTKEEINAAEYIINAVNLEDARCKAALIKWEDEQRQKNNEGKALLYAVEKTAERTKKEMIKKAITYLQNNLYQLDEDPINLVCASYCDSVAKFIENFKQAMEK